MRQGKKRSSTSPVLFSKEFISFEVLFPLSSELVKFETVLYEKGQFVMVTRRSKGVVFGY